MHLGGWQYYTQKKPFGQDFSKPVILYAKDLVHIF